MIEHLQAGTKDAVRVMDEGRDKTQATVEQAGRAGDSLDQITRAITSISDMNVQIASSAEEQSVVTEDINQNVTNINTIADRSAEVAESTLSASGRMAHFSDGLLALVGRFKV